MLTDWLLIRRVAQELDARLRGARVRDVGLLHDGRVAIAAWSRGATSLLCIDAFGSPPVVTVEDGDLPIANELGFVRALGASLRGTVLAGVKARRGDRLLRLDFSVRSRFGVVADHALILELVPRFGNAVLAKNDVIVAALREFSLAENGTRAILVGHAYQPPPLDGSRLIPKLIAENYSSDETLAIVERFGGDAPPLDDLFVYRRAGALVQAHLVELPSIANGADTACEREPSLIALLTEARRIHLERTTNDRGDQRRRALGKTLDARERKLRREMEGISVKRARARDREQLRVDGDAIFATLFELDGEAREEAKDRAASFFAQYKKLGASLPHLDEREAHLQSTLDSIADLRWELERAGDADLADVMDAVATLERRPERAGTKATTRRKRAPLEWRSASGSRIVVGRTPLENADVTFKIARPNDLWFHVQGQPGAHVILQRDDRNPPPEEDILAAAALAALHSKAKASQKVAIDYTLRKHVRKRPAAAPGLVFYTNSKTVVVKPADAPPL
jgi:predicted ribosome quality control (RQC) complex YloA/Tae2 family protein